MTDEIPTDPIAPKPKMTREAFAWQFIDLLRQTSGSVAIETMAAALAMMATQADDPTGMLNFYRDLTGTYLDYFLKETAAAAEAEASIH